MFTDMVGYTALGQRDEMLSLAVVEEQRKIVRPVLAKHHGREVKTIGDAFLVEFPNAIDAVRCAYDIQRTLREFNLSLASDKRIHLRIGIHVGEIVETNGDISGDAVNVTSRIEPLAEDGGVCLTQQVYDQVRGKSDLRLTSLGARSLKNVADPLEIYKMVMPWGEPGPAEPHSLDKRRVAVLPFTNMSPDPVDEFFADGMTEELITSLSGVNGLSVIARTSVMKYKGGSKGASEVAKELNAGTLVEGSVRKSGNKLRITVQMIDGQTESHAWAKNYDKQMDDIFAIQSDVAEQVAEALQVRLLSTDKKKLERAPTSNIEAYALYLKGIHNIHEAFGEPRPLRAALANFEEAIAHDPNFAQAYAQLAYCYDQLGFFGTIPSSEAGQKSKANVEKALSLDDSLPEAHCFMGRVYRNYLWDFQAAEREFNRAIELSPSYAEAIGNSALLKVFGRRFEEAVAEIKRGLELDPASSRGRGFAGTVYLYSERYEDAIEQFTKFLEFDPGSRYAVENLGLAHIQLGMLEQGLNEVIHASTIEAPSSQTDLAYAYARSGKTDDLKRLLKELLKEVTHNRELCVPVAAAYANLGNTDEAMEWLQKAYDEHSGSMVGTNNDFIFDSIRGDPRFQALMKKVGWTKTD